MLKQLFSLFREDDLYSQALRECHEMLDITLRMYLASVDSLRRKDTADVTLDVYATDQIINAFERDVRRKIMTHLAISGTRDLAAGLVLVAIVVDIERIGDYAKNIYDLAVHHPARLAAGSMEETILEIENTVTGVFTRAVTCFKHADIALARELMTTYKAGISRRCDELTFRMVAGQCLDLSASEQVSVALYLRFLKRIGAHSRNMITSVVNPFERLGYSE